MRLLLTGVGIAVLGFYLNEGAEKIRFKKRKTATGSEAQSALSLGGGLLGWVLMLFGGLLSLLGLAAMVCK